MKAVCRWSVCCLALLVVCGRAHAQEGVEGAVLRPAQVAAEVQGCKISKPGQHKVESGTLIEIDYSFPVVPTALPKKVGAAVSENGAVIRSKLGIRRVQTGLIGATTVAIYFEAAGEGEDTITVRIDDAEYKYTIRVK